MFCTNCGKELKGDAVFCGNCGQKLSPVTPSSNPFTDDEFYKNQTFGMNEYLKWKYGKETTSDTVIGKAVGFFKGFKNSKHIEALTEQAKDFQYKELMPIENQSLDSVINTLNIQENGCKLFDDIQYVYNKIYLSIYEQKTKLGFVYTVDNLKCDLPVRLMENYINDFLPRVTESFRKMNTNFDRYPEKRYPCEIIEQKNEFESRDIFAKIDNGNSITLNTITQGKEIIDFNDQIVEFIKQIDLAQVAIRNDNENVTNAINQLQEHIKAIVDQIANLHYFSKDFNQLLNSLSASLSRSLTEENISIEELTEFIENIEKDVVRFEQIYQNEKDASEKKYEQNKQFAEKLTNLLSEIDTANSDVVYSYEITDMAEKIGRLINEYKINTNWNPDVIEKKLFQLKHKKEAERDEILKNIEDYKFEIQRLNKLAEIYKKPNEDKLMKAFLKRIGERG